MKFYAEIKEKFSQLVTDENIWSSQINVVNVRSLTPQEAIGNPERDDFPLLKGKEVMIQAEFIGNKGQAFTDMPGNYSGTLREIFELPLINNFQRAIFTASVNAVLRSLKLITNSIHCRDKEPGICATHFKEYLENRFGCPKIAFIGFQPAMISILCRNFKIRVIDLDEDNIGKFKAGVLIEGITKTEDALNWADIIISTGTTAANNTLPTLLNEKPIIFYGVTISGIAYLMGYEQFCYCSH